MADTQQADDDAAATTPSGGSDSGTGSDRDARRTARLAKRISAFAASHGGSADGQIAYLGQRGVRLVLVAQDGTWGDLVAPSRTQAEQAAARAGITLHDTFDGELAEKVHTGPYEWSRMAGIQLGGPPNA
ncbi:hypothetical protein DVA86_10440 [Streptomyces armeniacus]|uniref:Uncharacterized protein n=1 Tax=Streptomyces armeniacus TaxID=83291 RepID=A0A345XMY8_9ACTN|nr:hypothetical protein [Streptomyces armeniacus]AXK33004.1 hypothetical protein DVA86_10440 [Streptomyces armeniacus]